jgi:hypothetical protein
MRRSVPVILGLSVCAALLLAIGRTPPPRADAAPAADIHAEALSAARAARNELGDGYEVHADRRRRLTFISALDRKTLKRAVLLLSAYTDAQKKTLLDPEDRPYITILLPTTDDYPDLAGDELVKQKVVGFYRPRDRTVISLDRGRILVHEFTHALHAADTSNPRQIHPVWVSEGLATLFESSRITPSGLKPFVDIRILAMKKAIRDETVLPLKKLFALSHEEFMKSSSVTYPQCRYVMYYLHKKQRLRKFYRLLKKDFTKDPTGRKAFETALGNRLWNIEPAWTRWVKTLQLPRRERSADQGRLGVAVKNTAEGCEVVDLVEGGPAETAGRIRVGDIIEKFNGKDVPNTVALFAAVRQAGALRTVVMVLRRKSRTITIRQPLGAPKDTAPDGK